ncbi:MAG TPA: hypothetical protein O0X39_05235 [Methanocorpusculum sp.]|nr:hypothetical protein [Methanocorpusculum sp.]
MQIVNVVVSGSFGQEINLADLSVLGEKYLYSPKKYPAGYVQLSLARITVYHTGKYIITGVRSLDLIEGLWKEAVALLQPLLDVSLFEKPSVRNIVAYEELGRSLNLAKVIVALHDEDAEYEPEVFPGLIWRTNAGTANIFVNGKVMLLGCRSEEGLEALWGVVSGKLMSL